MKYLHKRSYKVFCKLFAFMAAAFTISQGVYGMDFADMKEESGMAAVAGPCGEGMHSE